MTAARWRVSVDLNSCVSSGCCVALAGEWFELTDDGARPVVELIDREDAVIDAAEACPTEAIRVVDPSDNTVIAP
jgi:ferredoxin